MIFSSKAKVKINKVTKSCTAWEYPNGDKEFFWYPEQHKQMK